LVLSPLIVETYPLSSLHWWERVRVRGNKIKNQKLRIKMTDKNGKFISGMFWSLGHVKISAEIEFRR